MTQGPNIKREKKINALHFCCRWACSGRLETEDSWVKLFFIPLRWRHPQQSSSWSSWLDKCIFEQTSDASNPSGPLPSSVHPFCEKPSHQIRAETIVWSTNLIILMIKKITSFPFQGRNIRYSASEFSQESLLFSILYYCRLEILMFISCWSNIRIEDVTVSAVCK